MLDKGRISCFVINNPLIQCGLSTRFCDEVEVVETFGQSANGKFVNGRRRLNFLCNVPLLNRTERKVKGVACDSLEKRHTMVWLDGGEFEFKRRRDTQDSTANPCDFIGTCDDLVNAFKPDRC